MPEQTINTTVAPQTGPHATFPTTTTTYEVEVMFPWSTNWHPVTAITEHHQPFATAEAAYDWWATFVPTSDLYQSAQMRLVQNTRRVLAPAVEPHDGWPLYHRAVDVFKNDRTNSTPATR